jgi:hypothetical protein
MPEQYPNMSHNKSLQVRLRGCVDRSKKSSNLGLKHALPCHFSPIIVNRRMAYAQGGLRLPRPLRGGLQQTI